MHGISPAPTDSVTAGVAMTHMDPLLPRLNHVAAGEASSLCLEPLLPRPIV
jgi:hypothetical protein